MSLNTSGTDAGGLAFDNSGYLYAISGYFDVAVFAPGSRSFVRTITDGVFEPLAIAVDRSGNLYVANGHNGYKGNIAVYPPGSGTPSRTITEDIYDPESLAFDSAGNLYVGNGLYADAVTVYSPNGTLLRTITDGVRDPQSMRSMLVTIFSSRTRKTVKVGPSRSTRLGRRSWSKRSPTASTVRRRWPSIRRGGCM
jgi:sugar lactone lactonase YvrE